VDLILWQALSPAIIFYDMFSFRLGSINLYITGVTILANIVELIKPPINTIASGTICRF
jgi:hypothetical protein